MSHIQHPNFAIDEIVDNQVKRHFNLLLKMYTSKLPTPLSENEKLKMATQMIFTNKEHLKLRKKRKQAAVKRQTGNTNFTQVEKKPPGNLLKLSLLNYCIQQSNAKLAKIELALESSKDNEEDDEELESEEFNN